MIHGVCYSDYCVMFRPCTASVALAYARKYEHCASQHALVVIQNTQQCSALLLYLYG